MYPPLRSGFLVRVSPTRAVSLAVAAALVALAGSTATQAVAATPGLSTVSSAVSTSRPADTAGALPVGGTRWAAPSGAVWVSTKGSDASSGTPTRPVRTIGRALAIVRSGGTIVVRGGTYHESVTIASKRVTLQNAPGEAVWLDGSRTVTGWVADGRTWRHDKWTTRFDASVGYNKGARDSTASGWRWVNAAYPMAAHPDQVFVGSTALRQVASRAAVVKGTFYLDETTSRLYIGTAPSSGTVRASTLTKALSIRTAGTVVRGIGIRRYSPSIWHIGAVTVEAPDVTLHQVTVQDSATIGVGVIREDVLLSRLTVVRSGLLGVHAATADRLRVVGSRLDHNNVERFNSAPVSGGLKAGRSRGITVDRSSISHNLGQGYWSDVSVYDTRILRSNVVGNRAAGVFLEISARATVADNLITDNGGDGVKVNNTSSVSIWNNTVVRNGRPLNLVQDPRRPYNTSYGQDRRYPDDPEMTWLLGPVTVRNNVIGLPRGANCVLCVEDYSHERTAAQMGVTSNGNVFTRSSAASPSWLTVWSRGAINVNPAVYGSLSAHRSGTRQDLTSLGYTVTGIVATNGTLASAVKRRAATAAAPLPASVAGLVRQPSGVRRLGVFGR